MSQALPRPLAHHGRRPWRAVVVAGLAAVTVTAAVAASTPAAAQDPDARVDQLEGDRAATSRELDAATADLDDVRARITTLVDTLESAARRLEVVDGEVEALEGRVTDAQDEMFALQARIDDGERAIASRARSIYMHGQTTPVMELLSGNDVDTAMDRASMVNLLSTQDQVTVETAAADRANIDAAVDEVHLVQAQLVERRNESLDLQAQMEDDLAEASRLRDDLAARVDELDAREADLADQIEAAERAALQRDTGRQTAAPGPAGPGGRACPMHSIPQLFNDWGWPRGGGSRSHKGNDLYGDFREPVFAMASGIWDVQSYGNSAGNWAILRGDDGIEYWYMHLDAHAVGDGTRVAVGQQTAYNGWTGNAVGSVYHIHFEIHPGGGGAVDPYPFLAQVC